MSNDEYEYGKDKEWEVAKLLRNRRARTAREYPRNFWAGKTPCWEVNQCPDNIKNVCPAPKYSFLPCWQIEGTYCKLDEGHASGLDTSICKLCPVYKQYGGCSPLQIKLFCSGIDTSITKVSKSSGTRILN